eukprot:598970-Pelagomonas_calceolata.AAC.9
MGEAHHLKVHVTQLATGVLSANRLERCRRMHLHQRSSGKQVKANRQMLGPAASFERSKDSCSVRVMATDLICLQVALCESRYCWLPAPQHGGQVHPPAALPAHLGGWSRAAT